MTILTEGKKEFVVWAKDDDLVKRYLEMRPKLQAPENNMDYWISKKNGKTPDDLRNFLDTYKSKSQKEKEEKIAGTELVYEDDDWKVLHILTYEAAAYYGKDSTWCITGRYPGNEGPERGRNFFNSYLRSYYTGYYLFLNKKMTDPRKDAKYMVCPKQNDASDCDIFDQEHNPRTIPYIPNCNLHIKGLPYVGQFVIDDGVLTQVKSDSWYDRITFGEGIKIPNDVTRIKNKVFMGKSVERVDIPNSVESIGAGAFAQSMIHQIYFPDSVKELGTGVCLDCAYLTLADLGKGITKLSNRLFAYCDDLSEISIHGKISEIADNWLEEANKDVVILCNDNNKALIKWCESNNYKHNVL